MSVFHESSLPEGLESQANGTEPSKVFTKCSFITRYNAYCRLISGDYRGLQSLPARIGFWSAMALLKVSTAFIMAMIALAGIRNVPDFCDVNINLVSFLTIEAYAVHFVIRGPQFSSIVNKLAVLWIDIKKDVQTAAELKVIRNCEKHVRIFVPLLNSGALAILLGYATAPAVIFFTSTKKRKRMGLPFKMSPILDSIDQSTAVIVYVIAVICLTYSSFLIININALYLSVLSILECGLNLNGLYFIRAYRNRLIQADLVMKKGYVPLVGNRLDLEFKRSLVQHQHWLRVACELKEEMNGRFLILHMGTITVVTLGSFLTANDPAHHYYQIAMALVPLSIYFLFFYMTTKVSIASEATAHLLYFRHMSMPWIARIDPRMILLIIRRSQKPVLFQIGKIWHLSLIRFASLLQHMFSVIMVLRTISNRSTILTDSVVETT